MTLMVTENADCSTGSICSKTHWERGEEVRRKYLRKICTPLYFLATTIVCAVVIAQLAM